MSDLSETAQLEIQGRRKQFHAQMPDALPFVKDLVDCGLITGWRNLTAVKPVFPGPRDTFRNLCLPGNDFCKKKDNER